MNIIFAIRQYSKKTSVNYFSMRHNTQTLWIIYVTLLMSNLKFQTQTIIQITCHMRSLMLSNRSNDKSLNFYNTLDEINIYYCRR